MILQLSEKHVDVQFQDQEKRGYSTKNICHQISSKNAKTQSSVYFIEKFIFCSNKRDIEIKAICHICKHMLTKAFWHFYQAIYIIIIIFGLQPSPLTNSEIIFPQVHDQNCQTCDRQHVPFKRKHNVCFNTIFVWGIYQHPKITLFLTKFYNQVFAHKLL